MDYKTLLQEYQNTKQDTDVEALASDTINATKDYDVNQLSGKELYEELDSYNKTGKLTGKDRYSHLEDKLDPYTKRLRAEQSIKDYLVNTGFNSPDSVYSSQMSNEAFMKNNKPMLKALGMAQDSVLKQYTNHLLSKDNSYLDILGNDN